MDAPLLLKSLIALVVALAPSIAHAKDSAAFVMRGGPPAVERQVRDAIGERFSVAPEGTQAALARDWPRRAVKNLDADTVSELENLLEVADASGVDVVIAAEVESRGRGRRSRPVRLHLAALAVEGGKLIAQASVPLRVRGRGRRRSVRLAAAPLTRFFDELESALTERQPASPEKAPPDPFSELDTGAAFDDESPRAPTMTSSTESAEPTTLRASAGSIERAPWSRARRQVELESYGLLHGRSFQYYDTLTRNLREFQSGLSFGAGARLALYPIELERASGTTRRVGLVGGYAQDFGLQPTVADAPDVTLEHTWNEWFAGARVAWDFRQILLGAEATYGEYAARFSAPTSFTAARELPSTRYRFLGLGLTGRYEMRGLALLGDARYFFIRQAGKVGDRLFPNAAVGGLRLRAAVSVPLVSSLEIFAAGVYDHFFYDMRPQRGDEFLAGGALDLHFTGELGVSYAY